MKPESPDGPLDDLLRNFFKAEVPNPWPAFRAPRRNGTVLPGPDPVRGHSAHAGRLALAASVGLFLVGSWLLPTARPPRPDRPISLRTIGDPTAGKRLPEPSSKGERRFQLERGPAERTGNK